MLRCVLFSVNLMWCVLLLFLNQGKWGRQRCTIQHLQLAWSFTALCTSQFSRSTTPGWFQNSTSPPLHNHLKKKTKKKNIKKNPSPPHHNKLPKSHIFHMEIWKKSRAPWLLLQQRDLLRRRRRRHGPQELCLTKSCKEASSDVFFKACEWETHDNYLGYIIYYYIHVYNSPILFEYKGTVR